MVKKISKRLKGERQFNKIENILKVKLSLVLTVTNKHQNKLMSVKLEKNLE